MANTELSEIDPKDGRIQWAGWDGITPLPSEERLREFGFTDHSPEHWYYTDRVGSAESINITVNKEPVGLVQGKPVYGYRELIVDEYFGQPAFFGKMLPKPRYEIAQRISEQLAMLRDAGLDLLIDPLEYGWEGWNPDNAILGEAGELDYDWIDAAPESSKPQAEPAVSVPEPIDAEILRDVAEVIDREAKNLESDSLALGMSLGEYVAPTAIRTYLAGLEQKQQK